MIAILKPVGKALYYLSFPGLRLIGSLLSGKRVRVLVVSEKGTILLVKTWFGRQLWSLPGGGIEAGELPEHAAIRELAEETAIVAIASDLELLGETKGTDGLPFHLVVYQLHIREEQLAPLSAGRNYEIFERAWHATTDLPENISSVVAWSLGRHH